MEEFFPVIRLLNLDELAERMETCLSGGTEKLSPTREKQGEGDSISISYS